MEPDAAVAGTCVVPTIDDFTFLAGPQRDAAYLAVEREIRRLTALQAAMLAEVRDSQSYLDDHHRSPAGWASAAVNCSRGTANARLRTATMLAEHPLIAAAAATGSIGADQLRTITSLYANERARPHLHDAQDAMVDAAVALTARDFDLYCSRWLLAADPDGTHRDHETSRENRRAGHRKVGAGFEFHAEGDAMSGDIFLEIWRKHTEAELETDLAERAMRWGDAASQHPLARTPQQRAYDALMAMAAKAAGTKESTNREPLVTIHCTAADLAEAFVALFGGESPTPTDGQPRPSLRQRLCETASGTPVDLVDLAVAALVGQVQRIIVDDVGRVVHLGRKRRLFRGAARDAVLLTGDRCCWPGCDLRTGHIQVDHITPWARHFGETSSVNGGPLCQHHNIRKHRGNIRVVRDTTGWHFFRPDGSEIGARGAC